MCVQSASVCAKPLSALWSPKGLWNCKYSASCCMVDTTDFIFGICLFMLHISLSHIWQISLIMGTFSLFGNNMSHIHCSWAYMPIYCNDNVTYICNDIAIFVHWYILDMCTVLLVTSFTPVISYVAYICTHASYNHVKYMACTYSLVDIFVSGSAT